MTEAALHRDVARYLDAVLDHERVVWSTIAHGGIKLPIRVAVQLKRIGLRAGVPDIALFPLRMPAHFIELKAPGKYPEPHQRELHARLKALGHPVMVCRSVDEVEGVLKAWCVPMRGQIAA